MRDFLNDFGDILARDYAVEVISSPESLSLVLPDAIIQYAERQENIRNEKGRLILLGMHCGPLNDEKVTAFDLVDRKITGCADDLSERLRNQLRRYGVRFKYRVEGSAYVQW
jgi:hypothetical protein